jgi:hypothetical protein
MARAFSFKFEQINIKPTFDHVQSRQTADTTEQTTFLFSKDLSDIEVIQRQWI